MSAATTKRQLELMENLHLWGSDLAGVGDVGELTPVSLADLPFAVSAAVHLSERIVEEISPEDGPTQTYFHHYRTVNALLDQLALKTALQIQRWGYEALSIPASQSLHEKDPQFRGRFPHRMAATRAGLGWIGKSGCLITPEFGPRVRLVTVLTDMPLTPAQAIEESQCGDCRLCGDACPAGAIGGAHLWKPGVERELLVDPSLCSQHMKKAYQQIGRGAVCGICFQVCPWGRKYGTTNKGE